ncbi:hypothetical protein RG959_23390 [Domibacillus sp. 8LH]
MDFLVKVAEGFIGMFQKGGDLYGHVYRYHSNTLLFDSFRKRFN